MEQPITIQLLLCGKTLFISQNNGRYSWETNFNKDNVPKETNLFLSDLENYMDSSKNAPYYLGHFLFVKKPEYRFEILDGTQRITTIVILLSVLFKRLCSIRNLTPFEMEIYEDCIKRRSIYRLETGNIDNRLFKDYVIDHLKKDKKGIESNSGKRIVNAFDFFETQLKSKDEMYLRNMLNTVANATCTKHAVTDQAIANQMLVFHNRQR